MDKKSFCFAYFADGKFIGWYADTSGSVRKNSPKLYSDLERMRPVIQKNLSHKLKAINTTSFEEAKNSGEYKGLRAFALLKFDSEELLRGKDIELRVVECPEYDGPNPDFDKDAHEKLMDEWRQRFEESGVKDIPGPSLHRSVAVDEYMKKDPMPRPNNWKYCDYQKVKAWAENEPTEFVEVIKPEYDGQVEKA